MNRITRLIALTGLVGPLALVACDNTNTRRSDNATPVDHSAPLGTDANRSSTLGRDADLSVRGNETTAMDQSNSSEHIDITARIRRAVMEDDALSTRAKNGTIVTDGTGTVTLRGNVQSQAERDAIAAKAVAVVGSGRVVNHLVVNP